MNSVSVIQAKWKLYEKYLEETKLTPRRINIIHVDSGVRHRIEPWAGKKQDHETNHLKA